MGRIWRIVPEEWKPSKAKKLSNASPEELVEYLSHADGWHRDMAQRLLVEGNYKNAVPLLTNLILKGENHLGRVHALWALQGLKLLEPDLLFPLTSDHNTLVRSIALRLLEPFARDDENIRVTLEQALMKQWQKAPIEQILQIALSARVLEPSKSKLILTGITEKYGNFPLIRDAVISSFQDQEFAFLQLLWKAPHWQSHEAYKEIFLEMLATATMRKKDPQQLTSLLSMLDGKEQPLGWRQKAVLTGLAMGGGNKLKPIKLNAAPEVFEKRFDKKEATSLAALSSFFEWPGKTNKKNVSDQKSLLNDEQQRLFALGRQHYLTTCAGCHGNNGAGIKRFAPPLINSEWVLGDERRLALIVLHGMEGRVQVAGKVYDSPDILPVMPAHSTMDDAAITAILTYIRNEWGNRAGPIGKRTVGTTRNTSQGRVVPWKAEELKKYVLKTKSPESK
jgi:mono/diheme cytochrome c family protein